MIYSLPQLFLAHNGGIEKFGVPIDHDGGTSSEALLISPHTTAEHYKCGLSPCN